MTIIMAEVSASFDRLSPPSRKSLTVSLRWFSDSAPLSEWGSSMMTRSPRLPVTLAKATPSREPVSLLAKLVSPRRVNSTSGQSS